MHEHVTLMRPERRAPGVRGASSGLPVDLLAQAARRLSALALLYAFTFFMAGMFPPLFFPDERARFLASVMRWAPGVAGITAALIVAVLVRSPRVSLPAAMNVGLVFEIASSYAIAAAEFGDPAALAAHRGMLGLSWVAVWVVLFSVVVPTSPSRAGLAALGAVSSVPVIIGSMILSGVTTLTVAPIMFFFGLVFPYLLVVGMAYVGARVVYRLGAEVKRARDLGSYHLEEKLGEGGMGEVWRARHNMLARPAAVKLIRPTAGNGGGHITEEAVRRFEREAQAIAGLRSPHTVTLFDFGQADDGAFYYVMELLEGLDTDSLIRRFGPVPPERAVTILRQICHSLSEAHSRALVHRDVKPANIVLCRYGEEYDFVKVLDFGIVRTVNEPADTNPELTRENAVQGTPAFIAPEQATGTGVDARSDIYSAGCVLYWLLTGQPVFTAETPMALLLAHAQAAPTPPSARTELPIPAALDELVLACLAKDPADRPQSARELATRLARVEVTNAWTQERARDWWTTYRPTRAPLP